MKKIILGLWLSIGCLFLPGSAAKASPDVPPAVARILDTSKQIRTLACEFTEKKKIAILTDISVSHGRMYYKKSQSMRWEYTDPTAFYGITNAAGSQMFKAGKVDKVGTKVFAQISKLILTLINGQPIDEKLFAVSYEKTADAHQLTLIPQVRKLKMAMDAIALSFDLETYTIRAIEIRHADDVTRIEFSRIQLNIPLDDNLFQWK